MSIITPSLEFRALLAFSHIQLLGNGRVFLVTDSTDGIAIYTEQTQSLASAIANQRSLRHVRRERVGDDVSLAYDEIKRMLVICSVQAVRIIMKIVGK